jgi:hypothetical protein
MENESTDEIELSEEDKKSLALDFTTSSAISRVNMKFIAVYIPIFWLAGLLTATYWYAYTANITDWTSTIIFLPLALFSMYYIFTFTAVFVSKLFLILVNLIHNPREGIFLAEIGDQDFEFWCLRTEIKKIAVWLLRNSPFPWTDTVAFRWFGVKMDFSSHLYDAWVDLEFIRFGRMVMVGQGAVIMSSMVVGKYLIIKKIILDDYTVIGGQSTMAPGTIIGKETVFGACSTSSYLQFMEPSWIYFGIPAIKLKENKYAEERRSVIKRVDVVAEKTEEIEQDVNIDEDKRHLATTDREGK